MILQTKAQHSQKSTTPPPLIKEHTCKQAGHVSLWRQENYSYDMKAHTSEKKIITKGLNQQFILLN